MDPTDISDRIKIDTLTDGTKRLRVEDRLNPSQVGSYLSRKASKVRSGNIERIKRDKEVNEILFVS
jgi:hypothetical protein